MAEYEDRRKVRRTYYGVLVDTNLFVLQRLAPDMEIKTVVDHAPKLP